MTDRTPAYRGHVLHFDALRLIALREGYRTEEALATESEREAAIRASAHEHSAYAALCCWGKLPAHSQPTLRTDSMAATWRPALWFLMLRCLAGPAGDFSGMCYT